MLIHEGTFHSIHIHWRLSLLMHPK